MSAIQINDLSVDYNGLSVLQSIDFQANEGEFVVIVGRSGSGKSTFLHALAGLIPFSGQINTSKRIGLVFQKHAVFPWLTVRENIAFGLKETTNLQKETVQQYLKLSGLQVKAEQYPAELSGGQIQRVALARALANNPDILLMDEPYGSLDVYTRDKMQQWLLKIWSKEKKTIVFVTHDVEEAIFLGDRVLVLDNEHFVKEYSINFKRPRRQELRFSEKFNSLRQEIQGLLMKREY